MELQHHTNVLAIDGGGTRCRVALYAQEALLTVTVGPANVTSDFDGGVARILDALNSLADQAGVSPETLAQYPAFVGLAGVTGPDIANRLRAALPFRVARIEDDRLAALRGALGRREGVVALCGTGSFFGAQIAGTTRFCGGWGAVLGDEASAQWVGRSALSLTLKACDGRVPKTPLAKGLLQKFGDGSAIVRFAGTASPKDFGALAPLVTAAATKGDSLGLQIMTEGASEIARNLELIGWRSGLTICLTGGIAPHFQPYLPAAMQADSAPPAGEPLSGALELAHELAMEIAL